MELMLNGWIQIAKGLVENATITHPYLQKDYNRSIFVRINVVIVLQTKSFVMRIQIMLNGCIQIAKELVENATITHPYFQESHNLLIANGLHGQSRDIVQDLVEMEFKFLLDLS